MNKIQNPKSANKRQYYHLKLIRLSVGILCTIVWGSCQESAPSNYENIPAFIEEGVIQVVVEIPAGTSHKIEYQKSANRFEVDQKNGRDRVIDFLPYPANYGFIPSTLMEESQGGDGDALDVLLVSEQVPTGTVVAAKPIAALLLEDSGELDTKIIAVPIDSSKQIIQVDTYQDFLIEYDAARQIIEKWFLYYKGMGVTRFKGWRDEQYALEIIKQWQI